MQNNAIQTRFGEKQENAIGGARRNKMAVATQKSMCKPIGENLAEGRRGVPKSKPLSSKIPKNARTVIHHQCRCNLAK